MIDSLPLRDRAFWALTGGALTYGAISFGAAITASGWTSALCAGGLLAAGGALAVRPLLRDRNGAGAADGPPPAPAFLRSGGDGWAQSLPPSEWLRREGLLDVPGWQREGVLRLRLAHNLTPLRDGDVSLDRTNHLAWNLLALAFATRAQESPGDGERSSTRILEELAQAHALATPGDVHAALARLAARLEADLAFSATVRQLVARTRERHAMRETFLLALLREARTKGVLLASAEFLWLKGVDRGLFYALNNLGRRAFHVEGLAAIDHYRHEVAADRPLPIPHVDGALATLTPYLAAMAAEADAGDARTADGAGLESRETDEA